MKVVRFRRILKMGLVEFVDILDVSCERRQDLNDSELGLSNQAAEDTVF